MVGYSTIIGLFGFLDRGRWIRRRVRSTNFIFFVFVRNWCRADGRVKETCRAEVPIKGTCRVRLRNSIFFDFGSALGPGEHHRLTALPPVDAIERPFPAAYGGGFKAGKSVHRPGFIGQPAVSQSEDCVCRFRGMKQPLTCGLLVEDAGFEMNDALEIAVRDDGGLLHQVATSGVETSERFVNIRVGLRCEGPRNRDVFIVQRGVQAVAAAVAGGLLPAGGGDRSAGLGAVDPGGLDLSLGSHSGYSMHEGFGAGVYCGRELVCFVGVRNFRGLSTGIWDGAADRTGLIGTIRKRLR